MTTKKKKKLEHTNRGTRVGITEGKGRGIFATRMFKGGELIESAPLLIIPEKQWPFVSSTVLADYFFEVDSGEAALALGTASLYNHSFECNADYVTADDKILITATRDIRRGEEITIDYGWDQYHYYEKGIITKEDLEKALEEDYDEEDY